MLRKNRNVGRVTDKSRCSYGCCHNNMTPRQERRLTRRRERQAWKNSL